MSAPREILEAGLLARARARSSATLRAAAKKIGALPAAIKPHAVDVRVRGSAVNRGDLVFGIDGVAVLPRAATAQIVADGESRDAQEEDISQRLRAGETTMAIYGLKSPGALRSTR